MHAALIDSGFAAAGFFPLNFRLPEQHNTQAQKQSGCDDPLLAGCKNLFACLSPTLNSRSGQEKIKKAYFIVSCKYQGHQWHYPSRMLDLKFLYSCIFA